MGERMERGNELLKQKLAPCDKLEVRQGRRGWLQECLCCITKSDFKYYNGDKQIARSKEEFAFLCLQRATACSSSNWSAERFRRLLPSASCLSATYLLRQLLSKLHSATQAFRKLLSARCLH